MLYNAKFKTIYNLLRKDVDMVILKFIMGLTACIVLSVSICFGSEENNWKIGGKIHFEEQSARQYVGLLELNQVTRKALHAFFDIQHDTCAPNAKVLLKKENGKVIISHYEERSKPGVGEEMHATLFYTTRRAVNGHEIFKDICENLAEVEESLSCKRAPTLEEVAKVYQKLIKPNLQFQIADVEFVRGSTGNVIVAKLLLEGKPEIVNKNGKPISGGFLHITLVNVDTAILEEMPKIDQVVLRLNTELSGKNVKIADKKGQADLEFGVSGSLVRIRP